MTTRRDIITNGLGLAAIIAAGKAPAALVRSMAAARQSAFGRESEYTARDYVQSGLVAMWDGIENAGWGNHQPTLSAWKDLVGSTDLAIENGVLIDDNSIYRTSARGYYASSSSYFDNANTIECCCDLSDTEYSGSGKCIVMNTNQRCVTGYGLNGIRSRGESSRHFYVKNSIKSKFSTSVVYGSVDRIFFNGNDMNLEYSSGDWGFVNRIRIGGNTLNPNDQALCVGHIYSVRFYSRALADSEVLHNYVVDKRRFNLP